MFSVKKILVSCAAAFSLITATAKETVTIVYAFSPADTMAKYSRTLVEEANRLQNKYQFVFDTKPGAGNSVAANHVKNNANHILATSSAFFIRPIFYPNQSYDLNEFRLLMPQCDSPMGIGSIKYRSWRDVPEDRPVTIGVSGLGVTTHLVALQLASKYPNLNIVPFKSTNEALVAAVGGHIDLTVAFINDLQSWVNNDSKDTPKMTMLGVTGIRAIKQSQPLQQQGFPRTLGSMNAPHHLVVPKTTPDAKFNEWREILFKAAQAQPVIDSCLADSGTVLTGLSNDQLQAWFNRQEQNWKSLTQNVKID